MVFNLHEIRRYSLGMKHHLLILYIYEYITLLMQVYNESNMVVLSSIYKYCYTFIYHIHDSTYVKNYSTGTLHSMYIVVIKCYKPTEPCKIKCY